MKELLIIGVLTLNYLAAHAYDFKCDGIYYNITSEAQLTAEVTFKEYHSNVDAGSATLRYHTSYYNGMIVVPEEVIYLGKTYTVTGIGDFAFAVDLESTNGWSIPSAYYSKVNKIQSIRLPNTIQSIGYSAFLGLEMKNLVIPSSVDYIGAYALDKAAQTLIMLPENPPAGHNFFTKSPEILIVSAQEIEKYKAYEVDNNWCYLEYKEMIIIGDNNFQYSGKEPRLNITSNVPGYSMYTDFCNANINAGEHETLVELSFYDQDLFLFKIEKTIEYVINKAKLHVSVNNAEREYGLENPTFTYSSISGFVEGEDVHVLDSNPVLATKATINTNVGEYPIIATISDKNYEIDETSIGTLTITKAPLSVKVNDYSRTYGDYDQYFTYSCDGLRAGETWLPLKKVFTFETDATEKSPVGRYEIRISGGESQNYYFCSYISGTLTIEEAPLYIYPNSASRRYYEDNPQFTYQVTGFKFSNDQLNVAPTLTCEATISSPVGTYQISAKGAEASNYIISYQNGNLTITKRDLTIKAKDYTREYGKDNPDFEAEYAGFVNDENESILIKKPEIYCSATEASNAGKYTIVPRNAESQNYSFSYNNGTLTIDKAEQSITWEQEFDGLNVGDQVELVAQTSSGLPVSYILSDNIASTYIIGTKSYLDCVKAGNVTIRAAQDGDNNHYPALRVSKVITIHDVNAVNEIRNENIRGDIHDMTGRKVTKVQRGLLYIQNGRKIIGK